MLVTGEVGTGKTTLIHSLLKKLGDRVRTVFIFHTTIPFKELAKGILHELDLDVNEKGKQAILNRLNEYLARMPEDETVAVIIDEAQDLPERTAAEIGELIAENDLVAKKLQFIFAGQPEFAEKLLSQRLRTTQSKHHPPTRNHRFDRGGIQGVHRPSTRPGRKQLSGSVHSGGGLFDCQACAGNTPCHQHSL